MEALRKIIETKNNTITIDIPSSMKSTKFEVILLPINDESEAYADYIFQNDAFSVLNEENENIYSLTDGQPFESKK